MPDEDFPSKAEEGGILGERSRLQRHLRSFVARALLVALAPFALDGCVSIGVSQKDLPSPPDPSAPPRGTVSVDVYEKPSERDSGIHVTYPVLSELFRVEKAEVLVARSMNASWAVNDLPPGRYRLKIAKKIDANGNVVALDNPGDKVFEVAAGERTAVSVVLRKVPVFWIVVAVLTIVLIVVLVIIGIDRGKIHPPPLPPLPLPPVAITIPIGGGEGGPGGEPAPAPAAVDVFPAPGSVVAARRVTAAFQLSMPLAGDGIEEDAVVAVGTKSGEIRGTVSFAPKEWLLQFAPSEDFRPGEEITVTLDLGKLRGEGGRKGSGLFSTSFKVAP